MSNLVLFYLFFALGWAGFAMGFQLTQYSGQPLWKLVLSAALNFTLWPVCVGLALYWTQQKD